MKTRIEVYEIKRPKNVVASSEWNRKLSASEERKEIRHLLQYLDPYEYTHRIIRE